MAYKKRRRTKRFLSGFLCAAMLAGMIPSVPASAETTSITALRTEDLTNPLGIDDPNPTFSWRMDSSVTGQKQSAYQIKVSENKDLTDPVWDSGKVESDVSVGIKYGNNNLEASTRYYWNVTVWDKDGKKITSDTASFEMGLLGKDAWKGSQWIQLGTEKADAGEVELDYVLEADIEVVNAAVSLVFEASDKNNYLMWQILKTSEDKLILKPHYKVNGSYTALDEVDITEYVSDVSAENHFKIVVKDEKIETYVTKDSSEQRISTIDKTNLGGVGWKGGIGAVGYRTDNYYQEDGYIDNLKLTDYETTATGEIVKNYTFDSGSPFDGGTIVDGRLSTKYIDGQSDVVYGDFKESSVSSEGIPTFRREIEVNEPITSARIYATALGVFDLFINGERVGERRDDGTVVYDELKPGYTQPQNRVFSYAYDVTDMFEADESNIVTANVSTGWWNGAVANNIGKTNAFRAKIVLTYEDGRSDVIGTDEEWKTSLQGPVLSGDIFNGETYDATADLSYRQSEYDDSQWYKAAVNTEFTGEISAKTGPSVRVREDLTRDAASITVYDGVLEESDSQYGRINVKNTYQTGEAFTLKAGEKAVIDFGQNFAGWEKLEVEGTRGTVLTMRHGEMLNDNNGLKSRGNDGPEGSIYTANLRTAQATGRYILSGSGKETYQASHTFYGFRYLEISSTEEVIIHNVQGMVVTSIAEDSGHLTTGSEDVNQLISNIMWGQYSNYLSVPTDCPQRDERQGWAADTQVFSTAAAYNADVKGVLSKWMQDMCDGQRDDGAFPDTAPSTRFSWAVGNLGWADAGIIVPYNMYKMYGDLSVIEDNYTAMKKYMDVYLAGTNKNGGGRQWGDWLSYESNDDGLKALLGVAYYAWDAKMMSEMAEAIGESADAERYKSLYQEEKDYFQQQFVNADGSLKRGEQTACLFALYLDLLPDDASIEQVKQTLLDNIARNGNKLQTGFLGTSIIMQTLSKIGASDTAYRLLMQHDNPSWLYSVDQGATTIWERWNSYTKESGFGDVSMNSFNHYSYGAVAEWMYGYMAGIMYDIEQPGFKHIILQPEPDQEIGYANCAYESEYGTIASNWKYDKGSFVYDATVPANTSATIYVPVEDDKIVTVNGKQQSEVTTAADGIRYLKTENGKAVFEAVSGSYQFKSEVTQYCYVEVQEAADKVPYQISVNGGELQSAPTTLKVKAGEEITIKAVVLNDVDYGFAQWTGDATGNDAELKIQAEANMKVAPEFEWIGYENLAEGKTVDANSSLDIAPSWNKTYLTDGVLNHLGGNNGFTSDGYGMESADISSNPFTAIIDLGEEKTFNRIHLYPRTDSFSPERKPFNFPEKFEILISTDGNEYTSVYSAEEAEAPVWKPYVISLDEEKHAKYVQLKVTGLGTRDEASNDPYRLQLAEFGVYNADVDKSGLENTIQDSDKYQEEDFEKELWSEFQAALTSARDVLADGKATAEQVNEADENLKMVMGKLNTSIIKRAGKDLEDKIAGIKVTNETKKKDIEAVIQEVLGNFSYDIHCTVLDFTVLKATEDEEGTVHVKAILSFEGEETNLDISMVISKLTSGNNQENNKDSVTPVTGDSTNVIPAFFILLISAGMCMAAVIKRKR